MTNRTLILAVAAALACGGGDDGPSQPSDGGSNTATVSVINNQFNPSTVSVPVSGTVTWQWDAGGAAHNVNFQDGAPGSGDKTSGTFARNFTAAGTFSYFCTLHAGMAGTVTVTAATGGTGGGGTGGGGSGGGGGGAYP
jgi:plastocyanin